MGELAELKEFIADLKVIGAAQKGKGKTRIIWTKYTSMSLAGVHRGAGGHRRRAVGGQIFRARAGGLE